MRINMNDYENDELSFTEAAWDSLYDTVDNSEYPDRDAELIYNSLETCLKRISFGDYLKRFIYRKAELDIPFPDVPLADYQAIIKGSFSDTETPPSFEYTTAKLSALSKNWLTQKTVKRRVVFLLGFGLAMDVDDVNLFLTKALQEPGINAKNPFEVVCWYCYKNGYNFLKFEQLWELYSMNADGNTKSQTSYSDYTIGLRSSLGQIHDDCALMTYLSKLMTTDNESCMSVTSRECFMNLYNKSRDIIATIYNNSGDSHKEITREDVTVSDFENIICAAVPVDRHGNLTPAKMSSLNDLFDGRRFSRQHIGDILSGQTEINRFDLITLNFFIFSQTLDEYKNVRERYTAFTESTNTLLSRCFMGKIYVQNPYECFLLMCILSEDPLGTYADVWELSYNKGEEAAD